MGCDYYIFKCLKIEHSQGIAYIELGQREHAYFIYDFNVDSDDEDYAEKYDDWLGLHLEPQMKPVPIYSHGKFIKAYFEEKYGDLIDARIAEHVVSPPDKYSRDKGVLKSREDIITITKVEMRELR